MERPGKDTDLIGLVAAYYAARALEYDQKAGYMNPHAAGYANPEAELLRIPIKAHLRHLFEGKDVLEVACGTGYWTSVLAESAHGVLATDANPTMLDLAGKRLAHCPNVRLQAADAYSLAGIGGVFNAAFSNFWWSHMPRRCIASFLDALHARLTPGAMVIHSDQLLYPQPTRFVDDDGNLLEERSLSTGARYWVVKNFPVEAELRSWLKDAADNVHYAVYPEWKLWVLSYRTKDAAAGTPRTEEQGATP